MKLNNKIFPYILLAPLIFYVLIFFFFPFINAIKLAFSSDSGKFTTEYFLTTVRDPRFISAVKFTLLFAIVIIPVQLITAFFLALFINTRFKGSGLLLFISSIPLAISDLAAGLIFLSIFSESGFLNSFLHYIGVIKNPIYFLSYQHVWFLFLAVVIAEHWRATSIVLVILMAGLQMIEKDYQDAASIFGANFWKRTIYVTIPLLKPSIQSALIVRTIFAFQMFAVVLALAGDMIPVLSGEAYFWYSIYRNPHVASVYAMIIILISLVFTVFYIKLLRHREAEV